MAYSDPIFIDFETFSAVDLSKCGAFRYIEDDSFRPLLLAYAIGDAPVEVIDLVQDPEHLAPVLELIYDPLRVKVAHNCAFERAVLDKIFGYTCPEQWIDTMIMAAMSGLPMSLDAVGAALKLTDQKMKEGTALINYFSKPCKPTKANGGRMQNMPTDAPDKWATFIEYCRRDVEVEREIYYRLRSNRTTEFERGVFCADARINERGVLADLDLASAAIQLDQEFSEKASLEMTLLTDLANPNSVVQLKGWLADHGLSVDTLGKATVSDLLSGDLDPTVRRVLELRQLTGKTSTTKYEAAIRSACKDGRVRGITQYYGAGRTGRWAGRLVQMQNLPQNHLDDIADVRELVRTRDLEALELCYDSVPDVLSQLIRTAFIAKPGHTFLVADYSAIEARVTAYLAGEKWRLDTFRAGGDIYCASASQMFKVPVVKNGINGDLRQKGKISELALGYGGGVNALLAFGADKMGLTQTEMEEIVRSWRAASPRIVALWRSVENAARTAIQTGKTYHVHAEGSPITACSYYADRDGLRCQLPSGRVLTYWAARLTDDGIDYMAQNQTTRKWERTSTWGGKLVENIVQAFARDCLATALVRLEKEGFSVCFHVHDEVIAEEREGRDWQDLARIMCLPIDWAPDLPLSADGYATKFYKKD